MKLSGLIYANISETSIYLFNSISSESRQINLNDFRRICSINNIKEICNKKYLELVLLGFFVEDDFDEVKYLKFLYWDNFYNNKLFLKVDKATNFNQRNIYEEVSEVYPIMSSNHSIANYSMPMIYNGYLFESNNKYKIVANFSGDSFFKKVVLQDILYIKFPCCEIVSFDKHLEIKFSHLDLKNKISDVINSIESYNKEFFYAFL